MNNDRRHRSNRQEMPKTVKVTMYNVGFGDSFLLTAVYDNKKRHVLIDCGSSSEKKEHMARVVEQIEQDCEGHLDAVVATHRHSDHISAFGLAGIGNKLKALKPKLVIQPWTEHPDADASAISAPSNLSQKELKHLFGLKDAQKFVEILVYNPGQVMAAAGPQVSKQIARIASLSIYNKKAIIKLTEMGEKHEYVHAGMKTGLGKLLPGVNVTVLGPPTLEQSQEIRHQTRWDEDEFWKLYARVASASSTNIHSKKGKSQLFPDAQTYAVGRAPSYVRWVINQLDRAQFHNVKRIVRILDNALNNTSVILLFEVGDKTLLFPGDAQLESWQYALSKKRWREKLSQVSLYKVGHHGSTNATPKSLWQLFENRDSTGKNLFSLLSTERGHHSGVPRGSLVKALDSQTKLDNTQKWRRKLSEEYIVYERQ